MSDSNDKNFLDDDAVIEAAIRNANNFGPTPDMFHPDYGWIFRNNELTDAGVKFFEDQEAKYEQSKNK